MSKHLPRLGKMKFGAIDADYMNTLADSSNDFQDMKPRLQELSRAADRNKISEPFLAQLTTAYRYVDVPEVYIGGQSGTEPADLNVTVAWLYSWHLVTLRSLGTPGIDGSGPAQDPIGSPWPYTPPDIHDPANYNITSVAAFAYKGIFQRGRMAPQDSGLLSSENRPDTLYPDQIHIVDDVGRYLTAVSLSEDPPLVSAAHGWAINLAEVSIFPKLNAGGASAPWGTIGYPLYVHGTDITSSAFPSKMRPDPVGAISRWDNQAYHTPPYYKPSVPVFEIVQLRRVTDMQDGTVLFYFDRAGGFSGDCE